MSVEYIYFYAYSICVSVKREFKNECKGDREEKRFWGKQTNCDGLNNQRVINNNNEINDYNVMIVNILTHYSQYWCEHSTPATSTEWSWNVNLCLYLNTTQKLNVWFGGKRDNYTTIKKALCFRQWCYGGWNVLKLKAKSLFEHGVIFSSTSPSSSFLLFAVWNVA